MTLNKNYYFLSLPIFILSSFAKMPIAMLQGRIWGEEGTTFIADMYSRSFFQAIFYQYKGTVQIPTAIITWIASRSPPEYIPYITTYSGFLFVVIVFSQLFFFLYSKGLSHINLFLFFVAWMFLPESYEVWASSTNIQWFCSISIFLIAISSKKEIASIRMSPWILLCGLSGVPSCMMAPVFIVRAWSSKSIVHALFGLVLTACAIIQLIVIVTNGTPERSFLFRPIEIFQVITLQTILVPLCGVKFVGWLLSHVQVLLFFEFVTIFAALFFIALLISYSEDNRPYFLYPLAMWIVVSALNVIGSLEGSNTLMAPLAGSRYFFFGATCFCLILSLATVNAPPKLRILATALLFMIGISGLTQRGFSTWPAAYLYGPSWRHQLGSCAPQEICRIKIWPDVGDRWVMFLPARGV